eukprot:750232-Amorphochlora_amoeboformis.AAC.2
MDWAWDRIAGLLLCGIESILSSAVAKGSLLGGTLSCGTGLGSAAKGSLPDKTLSSDVFMVIVSKGKWRV